MSLELLIKQSALKYEDEQYRIIVATIIDVLQGDIESKTITVKGTIPKLYRGEKIIVNGTLENHKKYGKQLNVKTWRKPIPNTESQLIKYFSSNVFKGIGKKTAEKIVKQLGIEAIQKITEYGESVLDGIEISNEKKTEIVETVRSSFLLSEAISFYGNYGIESEKVLKVYSYCKDMNTLLSNPYLFAKYRLVNFALCDKIAFEIGMFPHAIERIETIISLLLMEVTSNGDCYIEEKELLNKILYLLNANVSKEDHIHDSSIISVLEQSKVCEVEEGRVYPSQIYQAETNLAKEVTKRINKRYDKACDSFSLEFFLLQNAKKATEEQRQAVRTFINNNIMILSGNPGTGKTFTLDLIIKSIKELLKINPQDIGLAAPTGRAAKRISQSINENIQATTLHRMLGYGREGKKDKPYYNKENPLEYKVVIVDEFSMVDVVLANNLLSALKEDTKLCIVGDPEQLESVGPGNVLKDLMRTSIPIIELSKVFRQGENSKIIESALRIKDGEMIDLSNGNGQFFIESENPYYSCALILKSVEKLIKQGYSINDISVLVPMKKSVLGVEKLNDSLRNLINPTTPDKKEIEIGNKLYREGDKVMYMSNNRDLDIYNGDLGIIQSIDLENHKVIVEFDNHLVELEKSDIKDLILAYCTSIHKAQGSQSKIVIIAMSSEHDIMLRRNLLFTAITRAESICVLVGESKSIQKAINTTKSKERKTTLSQRINTLSYIKPIYKIS